MSESSTQRYQLIERIGHGGMAVVHRAHDSVLERTVALKILHPHLAERADSRARFAREAKAVARLKHPHIVEVFDYASADSEQSYIVTIRNDTSMGSEPCTFTFEADPAEALSSAEARQARLTAGSPCLRLPARGGRPPPQVS